MRDKFLVLLVFGLLSIGAAACGEGDSSNSGSEPDVSEEAAAAEAAAEDAQDQVAALEQRLEQQEQQAQQQARAARQQARQARADARQAREQARQARQQEAQEAAEPAAVPDVVGLTLPTAQQLLRQAGYKAEVSNTDTTFGILNPANYTVCTQDEPIGNFVPILAQKYGC